MIFPVDIIIFIYHLPLILKFETSLLGRIYLWHPKGQDGGEPGGTVGIQRIPLGTLQSGQMGGDTGVFLTLFFFFLPSRLRLCRTAASCNSMAHSCGSCLSPARVFFFPQSNRFFFPLKNKISKIKVDFLFSIAGILYIYIKSAKRCFEIFFVKKKIYFYIKKNKLKNSFSASNIF